MGYSGLNPKIKKRVEKKMKTTINLYGKRNGIIS
jgi:hypothetical protein